MELESGSATSPSRLSATLLPCGLGRMLTLQLAGEPFVFPINRFPIDKKTEPVLEREGGDVGLAPLFLERLCHAGEAERNEALFGWMREHCCSFLFTRMRFDIRWLSPETLALLRAWWPIRSTKYDPGVVVAERWLFPGRRKGLHLTPRQVSRLFQETVAAAGLKKKVTLHTLRHSFATHLYDRGVDIRTIQALLGHEKLETTARYARVATGLITAVESPLDQLGMPHSARIAATRRRRKAKPGNETAA